MPCQRDEIGRGREIAVPEVVVHGLEMPQPFPGRRIECDERVREQVGAGAGATIEVRCRRTRGDEHDAPPLIDRHPRPRVRAARRAPGLGRPAVGAELPGARDRVERPTDRTRPDVVGANVARRRSFLLPNPRPLDEQILVDNARAGGHQIRIIDIARQTRREIDRARITEREDRASCLCVERVQPAAGREEDPLVSAVGPVHDAAIDVAWRGARRVGRGARVEAPDRRPVLGVQRNHGKRGRGRVQHAIHNDGCRLDLAVAIGREIAGVIDPRHAQLRDVAGIDLIQRGVARVAGGAACNAPIIRRRSTRGARGDHEEDAESQPTRRSVRYFT